MADPLLVAMKDFVREELRRMAVNNPRFEPHLEPSEKCLESLTAVEEVTELHNRLRKLETKFEKRKAKEARDKEAC